MALFIPTPSHRPIAVFALLLAIAFCATIAAAQETTAPAAFAPPSGYRSVQPRIVVRPPVFRSDSIGRLVVEPNVQFRAVPKRVDYDQYAPNGAPGDATAPLTRRVSFDIAPDGMAVPMIHQPVAPGYQPPNGGRMTPPAPQPIFGEIVSDAPAGVIMMDGEFEGGECDECDECSPFKQLFAFKLYKSSCDPGIGQERVRFALMEIERTEPLNNFSIRYNGYNGLHFPDRAEYFWARQGRSPSLPERKVDYQEVLLRLETGGKRFSMFTQIPFRILDPDVNMNTAGLSDISFGPKMVIVDGKRWQLSHLFTTFVQSGSPTHGTGTGHTSLEPGFMLRYKWTDNTYLHGDIKWRFPIGGDPEFQGDVLKWGLGVSTVLYETDTFAVLPTLEFVGWHVLDGMKTQPDGIVAPVDGESFYSIYPGMRFVLGPACDLGLFDLGIGGGFTFGNNGFFETMFRLDLRFSF